MGLCDTIKKLGDFLKEHNIGVDDAHDMAEVDREVLRDVMAKLSEVVENTSEDLDVIKILEDALAQLRGEE